MTHGALISICERDAVRPFGRLGAAFMVAARNRANDLYKKRKWQLPVDPGVVERRCVIGLTDDARLEMEVRVVQQAFMALDSQSRLVVTWWAYGFTRREIADKVGLPYTKTRNLIDNTIKKLRREVGRRCSSR